MLPVYRPDETTQQAWYRLIDALANPWRFELATALGDERQTRLYPSWGILSNGDADSRRSQAQKRHLMNPRKDIVTQDGLSLVAPIALPCQLFTKLTFESNPESPKIPQNTQTVHAILQTDTPFKGQGYRTLFGGARS